MEIDEPHDLQIAEILLQERDNKDKIATFPQSIEAIVLDFDGVLTDNKVMVFENGQEGILADRGDGFGLSQIKKNLILK